MTHRAAIGPETLRMRTTTDVSGLEASRMAALLLPARLSPLEAGAQILEPLARATGAERASLLLLDPRGGELFMLAGRGVPEALVGTRFEARPNSIAAWVLRHGHGRLLHGDVREDGMEGAQDHSIGSSLCLPLRGLHGTVGVLNLARAAPATAFTEADHEAVQRVLPEVGLALADLRERVMASTFAAQLRAASAARGRHGLPEGGDEARGWEFAYVRLAGAREASDFCERLTHANGAQTIVAADVAGDGVEGSLAAAFAQGLFVAHARGEQSASGLVTRLDADLHARLGATRLVSAWVGVLSPGGVLSSCNAGYPSPLWVHCGDDGAQPLSTGGPPLGSVAGIAWEDEQVRLLPGDLVVAASDAVHAALDPAHRGLAREHLHEIVREHERESLERLATAACSAALERSGGAECADDFVVLALRYAPEARA